MEQFAQSQSHSIPWLAPLCSLSDLRANCVQLPFIKENTIITPSSVRHLLSELQLSWRWYLCRLCCCDCCRVFLSVGFVTLISGGLNLFTPAYKHAWIMEAVRKLRQGDNCTDSLLQFKIIRGRGRKGGSLAYQTRSLCSEGEEEEEEGCKIKRC